MNSIPINMICRKNPLRKEKVFLYPAIDGRFISNGCDESDGGEACIRCGEAAVSELLRRMESESGSGSNLL